MAICCITQSIGSNTCNPETAGGISRVVVFNKKDIQSYTRVGCRITGITMCSGKCGYEITYLRNTGNMTVNTPISDRGTYTTTVTVTGAITISDAATLCAIKEYMGADLVFLVEDAAGTWFVFGVGGRGAYLSAFDYNSGTAPTDANEGVLTFQSIERAKSEGLLIYFDTDKATTDSEINALICGFTPGACGCDPN